MPKHRNKIPLSKLRSLYLQNKDLIVISNPENPVKTYHLIIFFFLLFFFRFGTQYMHGFFQSQGIYWLGGSRLRQLCFQEESSCMLSINSCTSISKDSYAMPDGYVEMFGDLVDILVTGEPKWGECSSFGVRWHVVLLLLFMFRLVFFYIFIV